MSKLLLADDQQSHGYLLQMARRLNINAIKKFKYSNLGTKLNYPQVSRQYASNVVYSLQASGVRSDTKNLFNHQHRIGQSIKRHKWVKLTCKIV
jgi:hypothetical protein